MVTDTYTEVCGKHGKWSLGWDEMYPSTYCPKCMKEDLAIDGKKRISNAYDASDKLLATLKYLSKGKVRELFDYIDQHMN